MHYASFTDLRKEIQELYQSRDYATAKILVETQKNNFPEQKHYLQYWTVTLSALQNQIQDAISTLQEMLDDGFWLNESLLRVSPALDRLQGVDQFEELIHLNNKMRQIEEESLFPILVSRPAGECLSEDKPCPLLFAFHSNASTAQYSFDFWGSAAKHSWLVAAPQSSQAMWQGAYTWDDRDIAWQEIQEQIHSLRYTYSVDENRIALAGLAGGADIALYLCLRREIESRGFIVINPACSISAVVDECLSPSLDYSSFGTRGYFILGEMVDEIEKGCIGEIIPILSAQGIQCKMEEIPLAGYPFENKYSLSLINGLNFLLGK